jgi:hypothetical protein
MGENIRTCNSHFRLKLECESICELFLLVIKTGSGFKKSIDESKQPSDNKYGSRRTHSSHPRILGEHQTSAPLSKDI